MLDTIRNFVASVHHTIHQTIVEWYPSANLDAQLSHTGWGAFIVLAASLAWGPLVAWLILLFWIGIKEFGFDLVIEQDTILASVIDSSFYILGGLIGAFTFWRLSC